MVRSQHRSARRVRATRTTSVVSSPTRSPSTPTPLTTASFASESAWPVLDAVAEWIRSRASWTDRGLEIRRAMGVAERHVPYDNDAFTNIAAAAVLRDAMTIAQHIGTTVPDDWAMMADRMVLAVRDGVILDHDGFSWDEEKAATPSAPAAVLLFDHPVDPAVASATRRAYLDVADEYVGSPMLSSLLGVLAAHEGDRRRSSALFDDRLRAVLFRPLRQRPRVPAGSLPRRARGRSLLRESRRVPRRLHVRARTHTPRARPTGLVVPPRTDRHANPVGRGAGRAGLGPRTPAPSRSPPRRRARPDRAARVTMVGQRERTNPQR